MVFSVQLTGISSLATHLDMQNNAIAVEQMIDKGVRGSQRKEIREVTWSQGVEATSDRGDCKS